MARFRSKPVETEYIEAIENKDEFIVQRVDRNGRALKNEEVRFIKKEDFHRRYEPVVRKPRESKTEVPGGNRHPVGAGKN